MIPWKGRESWKANPRYSPELDHEEVVVHLAENKGQILETDADVLPRAEKRDEDSSSGKRGMAKS